MPDPLIATLRAVQRRHRWRAYVQAVTVGGAVYAAVVVLTGLRLASIEMAALPAIIVLARHRRLTAGGAARLVESVTPLDNLVVTAAELEERPRPVRAEIRDAIRTAVEARLARVEPARVVPLTQSVIVATVVMAGCVLLGMPWAPAGVRDRAASPETAVSASTRATLTVHVTPPAYTGRASETLLDPVQVTVLAGSRIRITSGDRVLNDWTATQSAGMEVRVDREAGPRFLSVIVVADAPPVVRIHEPGRDVAFPSGTGSVPIAIEGLDDLGLGSLMLRYTKVSGGGENVTFVEGEAPIRIERTSGREWRGRGQLTLDGLDLAEGDALVYRAVARDTNPAGAPVQSDAFMVEIGRASEIASAGFALPAEEKKYAISQQMVIYKTEQLLAKADRPLEQSQLIAMEQRMVRAEVVFLGGGEIEDEVEEAAHSHELAEGRLENRGRAEMLRAINFMSRAEAQLNDGRPAEALPLERQALASLERALDRRRYFLRTLPDRSRIDATRRLTGDRRDARSWTRERATDASGLPIAQHRVVMTELAALTGPPVAADATLAARLAAIDPASTELQSAAVELATAQTEAARHSASRSAMQAVTRHALKALPGAAAVHVPSDPLAGRLTEQRKR